MTLASLDPQSNRGHLRNRGNSELLKLPEGSQIVVYLSSDGIW
jgi:hypothetical protein